MKLSQTIKLSLNVLRTNKVRSFLTGLGIIIGIAVSYLAFLLMNHLGYDWAFIISWISIVLSVGVSVLTGVVFGLFPALKAAKLDPIESLRYE